MNWKISWNHFIASRNRQTDGESAALGEQERCSWRIKWLAKNLFENRAKTLGFARAFDLLMRTGNAGTEFRIQF